MNNGHGTAGAAGAQLFAEYTIFTGIDRRVIETAGVDGDLVPVMQNITGGFRIFVGGNRGLAMKFGP